MRLLKQSTTYNLLVKMFDSNDHLTGKEGLTLSVSASKNGAAFASISPTVTELSDGWYVVALTASHSDTAGDLVVRCTASGADETEVVLQVQATLFGDLATASALAAVDDLLDTEIAAIKAKTDNLPSDPADASDIASSFGSIAATLSTIAGYLDTEVASIKTVTDKLDDTLEDDAGTFRFTTNALEQAPTGGGGGTADWTADERTAIRTILGIPASGTIPDTPTAGILDTLADALTVVDGNVDAVKAVTDNLPDSGALSSLATAAALATVDSNVDAILVDTGTTLQAELDGIQADTEDIQSRLPAALVGGRMDSSVGAMAANVLTAAATAADFGTEVATAVWASATRTLTALTGGTVAADIRTALGLASADLDTQLDDIAALLAIIDDYVDEVEGRLTATRAGYLDNLSGGAAALQSSVDDLEGRLTAALATVLQAYSLAIGRVVIGSGSTTTAIKFDTVDGAAPSGTNDFYNGRVLVFTSGSLKLQAVAISDYDGATTTATVTAATSAPGAGVTAVLV